VRFHEFPLLTFELVALEPQLTLVGFGLCTSDFELAPNCPLDLEPEVFLEVGAEVVLDDLLLYLVDQNRLLGAVGSFRVAACAHEVFVYLSGRGAGHLD
jgi:hypothetical protein